MKKKPNISNKSFEEFKKSLTKKNVTSNTVHYYLPNQTACIISKQIKPKVHYELSKWDFFGVKEPIWSYPKKFNAIVKTEKEAFKLAYEFVIWLKTEKDEYDRQKREKQKIAPKVEEYSNEDSFVRDYAIFKAFDMRLQKHNEVKNLKMVSQSWREAEIKKAYEVGYSFGEKMAKLKWKKRNDISKKLTPIKTPKKVMPKTTKKPRLKRITKKEITEAFLKRPSTKISAMELSFFLKLYDSEVKQIILKDGKMATAMFKKLEQSELVKISYSLKYSEDIVQRTKTGNELYKKFDAFRTSYATEKNGGVIDFSKKVVAPKQTKYIPKAKISTSSPTLRSHGKDIRDGRIKSDWLVNGREASYWRDNPPRLILNPQDKSFRQGIKLPEKYIKNANDFELLKKMFGVKGFEFGRWTNYEDRYNYLVGLSAALYDLSEVLSIPKTKIGLNLGIAFGARGASKALAHYEPYNHIINLTRFKGVERLDNSSYRHAFLQSGGLRSLTHEWGHAFDYYVGGGANQSLSNGSVSLHQIPFFSNVGLVGLMKNVLLKLCYKDKEGKEKSLFAQRVLDTDSDYYARCNEIFARSFEVYVYLKMKQKGCFNVFLAKGKYDDDGKLTNKFSKRVYPTENEMRNVMKDFDLLISKMKQKL